MLDRMSSMEFSEWQAAYDLDPWGPERADLIGGTICHVLDACHRIKGKPKSPGHYMPKFGDARNEPEQVQTQSDDEMKANFRAFKKATAAMRAKVKANQ